MKISLLLRIWRNKRSQRKRVASVVLNRNRKDKQVTPKARQQTATDTRVNSPAPEPDQIALLAYTIWQQRGCPEGSPEADWLRAEEELAASR
jgi:Protein of unknown function (DUF2934)